MMGADGITASRATSAMDDPTRWGGTVAGPIAAPKPKSPLDGPVNQKRLTRLRDWFQGEVDRQASNRYQMALDCQYYDSLQWSEEEAEVLMDRGQSPCVYNEIKPTIDWLIGTEQRTRIDYKVLPRRKEEADLAEVKTKLLKYLSDTNGSAYQRSRAFAAACKSGVGWLEVGLRGDESDEPLFYRAEDWRYMLYDSQSLEADLSDARYVFRWKWVDLDVAEAMFPKRKAVIQRSAVTLENLDEGDEDDPSYYLGARVSEPGSDYQRIGKYRPYDGASMGPTRRDRVKLVEAWYREPERKAVLRGGGMLSGQDYDASNPEQARAIEEGASVYDGLVMQVRCAIYVADGLLYEGPSPYRHGRFPFVPIWAYRRTLDNAPYSPIRVMRDSQDSLNKRGSKALWILSSNRIVMEEGAVDDIEMLRDEAARPDAIIVKNRGKELIIDRDVQLADQHLRLMDRDALAIRNTGGVTAENLGRETNASSGKAIIARQDQGGVITSELFDNLKQATQWAGEIELSLVEQFFTEEKVVRLVGDRGNASFVEVNTVDPATGQVVNDITATKADFVVSQQDYRDTLRIAMFESLFEIVGRLAQMNPQVALNLLDLVVEMADVPNRDELVARIRQMNGQRDPQAEPTPEEQQQLQAQAQAQQAQQQMMMEAQQVELAKLKAEVAKLGSDVEKAQAESINTRLEAMYSALQSAQIVAQAPGAAVMADEIMKGAGFSDRTLDAEAELISKGAAGQPRGGPGPMPAGMGAGPGPAVAMPQEPGVAEPSPNEGARMGIETPTNDGLQ